MSDLNQIIVKQLKSRYNDINKNKRFIIGIDRAKMKLYDVEQGAQEDIIEGPVFDATPSGTRINTEKKSQKNIFDVFKEFD